MTRSRFLLLFGASASSAAAIVRTPAEEAEEAEICRVTGRIMQTYAAADYAALAEMLHPQALTLVFDTFCTGLEKLIEYWGEERVLAVTGLAAHPRKLGLNHADFYVHFLQLLNAKHPGFTAAPPGKDLKIIGGIIDPQWGKTYAHVLYDYRSQIESKTSVTEFVRPRQLTLIHTNSGWQSWSALAVGGALTKWNEDLLSEKAE